MAKETPGGGFTTQTRIGTEVGESWGGMGSALVLYPTGDGLDEQGISVSEARIFIPLRISHQKCPTYVQLGSETILKSYVSPCC